jgi:hypothetical protein
VNKDLHTKIEGAGSLKGGAVAENAKNDPICKQALDICMLPCAVSHPKMSSCLEEINDTTSFDLAKSGRIVSLETNASISIEPVVA